jgi:hypothetical protein
VNVVLAITAIVGWGLAVYLHVTATIDHHEWCKLLERCTAIIAELRNKEPKP